MGGDRRYKLFRLFLIFTVLNIFGIFFYENIYKQAGFRQKPEFYVEAIRTGSEGKDGRSSGMTDGKNDKEETIGSKTEKSPVEADKRRVLILGDSNIYLMSRNEELSGQKYAEVIYWLAESGATPEFINENLRVTIGRVNPDYTENSLTDDSDIDLIDEIKKKRITDIAVMIGVNSLNEASAKELGDKLIGLSSASKIKIHYISVLPYTDKGRYNIKNGDILKFNEFMRKKLQNTDIDYVDAYETVSSIKDYEKETSDGLHYSSTIYNKIFDEIMNSIVQNH